MPAGDARGTALTCAIMYESAPMLPLLTLVAGDREPLCCLLTCSIMNESAPIRPLLLLALLGDRIAAPACCRFTCSLMNESATDFGEDRVLAAPRAVAPLRDGGFGTCETGPLTHDAVKVVGG